MIASFEGLRRRAARLPDGRWTIGYGHTLSAREGAEVSREDAEALLHFDLLPIAEAVNNLVFTPLTQNQFDALVAFAYNVGVEAFRTSDVLRRVNEGRLTEAACALDLWRKAELAGDPVILDALIRRRAAEKALFLTPPDGFVPTPTPLLRPFVDDTLAPALPQSRPADIDVPMEGDSAEVRRLPPEPQVSPEAVELSESEAEPVESQPLEAEPVDTFYADAPGTDSSTELEVEALEESEPGAEAIAVTISGGDEAGGVTVEGDPEDGTAAARQETGPEPFEPGQEASAPTPGEQPPSNAPAAPEPASVEGPSDGSATDTGEDAAAPAQPDEAQPAAAAPAERIYAPENGEVSQGFDSRPEGAAPPTPQQPRSFGYAEAPLSPAWRVRPVVQAQDPGPQNALVLTPPPEVMEAAEPAPPPGPSAPVVDERQQALFEDASAAQQAAEQRVIRHEDISPETTAVDRPSLGPFVLMGAIGFVAFAGALSAFFKGRSGAEGVSDLTVIAWILALIGAACVGTSVYFLLKRLGGVQD